MFDKESSGKEFPKCWFNDGVFCEPTPDRCRNCGWNPIVSEICLNAYCKAHRIQKPMKNAEKQENS